MRFCRLEKIPDFDFVNMTKSSQPSDILACNDSSRNALKGTPKNSGIPVKDISRKMYV